MNLFDVYGLSHILHKLTQSQLGFFVAKVAQRGVPISPQSANVPVDQLDSGRTVQAFNEAEMLFQLVGLDDCLKAVKTARFQWSRPLRDASSACEITHRLQMDIVDAMKNREFLRIADDRTGLVDQDELFGRRVAEAFPSAKDDIREAGNCLAAECNTGAVFHLMRAAEVGLRALAIDREAEFKNKPITQQDWGTILMFLDGILKDMRGDALSKWPDPEIRDVQTRFYAEVIGQLRGFNEAWRRHISHAREDGIYGRDYANGVYKHVRSFMIDLSAKISEHTTTPKYWTANEAKSGI